MLQVWEFPVSVIFIVDMLVLTSNAVALKGQILCSVSLFFVVCYIAMSQRFLFLVVFLTLNLLMLLPVMTESTTSRCLAACFMAHSIKFLADQISGSRSLKHLGSVMYLPFIFKNVWSYNRHKGRVCLIFDHMFIKINVRILTHFYLIHSFFGCFRICLALKLKI